MRGVGRSCGADRVIGPWKVPNGEAKEKQRCTMNKKIITKSVKVAVTAGALATALTGCCLFGSKDCCDKKCCTPCCCAAKECCKSECGGLKKHGVNTSMTLGVGTDGIRVGSDSNVGSHGASLHANTDAGANGMTAGAGGGVR